MRSTNVWDMTAAVVSNMGGVPSQLDKGQVNGEISDISVGWWKMVCRVKLCLCCIAKNRWFAYTSSYTFSSRIVGPAPAEMPDKFSIVYLLATN